jgi:hypothetical protein
VEVQIKDNTIMAVMSVEGSGVWSGMDGWGFQWGPFRLSGGVVVALDASRLRVRGSYGYEWVVSSRWVCMVVRGSGWVCVWVWVCVRQGASVRGPGRNRCTAMSGVCIFWAGCGVRCGGVGCRGDAKSHALIL